MTLKKNEPLLSGNLIREAAKESLKKLSPKAQAKNPVMLIVYPVSYTHLRAHET